MKLFLSALRAFLIVAGAFSLIGLTMWACGRNQRNLHVITENVPTKGLIIIVDQSTNPWTTNTFQIK